MNHTMTIKVLIIEDNRIIQHVHRRYLESLGCIAITANNANDALALFQPDIDLILLAMVNDGLNTCRALRQQKGGKNIPIIGLTTSEEKSVAGYRQAGVTAIAIKPILPEELKLLLQRWVPSSVNHLWN